MGSRKRYKGFTNWFSTFCENFMFTFLKITKIKQKTVTNICYRVSYMPYLNGMFPSQGAPKVLLEPNKDFYSLYNCTTCIKLGENQQRAVCKTKTQTLDVWNNYSKLALKN